MSVDRAFARFCAEGDAEALAVVFDATAPRLLVLAGHLLPGDAGAAEDLVQSTFLAAIEAAPRFTPGRRVLPWLVTILARRAANLRRDRRRRRRQEAPPLPPDDLAALVAGAPDPAKLAADRELADCVARAIERLNPPYREVLALRLVHDLDPGEIARALGRPPGTVHAQLHRGAERLRRMLPVGAALAVAGALPAARGLGAVRGAVLEAARNAQPWATATATLGGLGGVLAMKKVVTVLLAASAVVLWAALSWVPGGPASPDAAGGSLPEMRRSAAAAADAAAGQSGPRTGRHAAQAAPEVSSGVTFTGRTVAWESAQPLPGVVVEGELRARISTVRPIDIPSVTTTTDEQGRFVVRLPEAPAGHFYVLSATAPGRATMANSWGSTNSLRNGVTVDSGDIEMALGAMLRLHVTDQDGNPVPGYGIQLEWPDPGPGSSDGAWSAPGWGGMQLTDEDGLAGPRAVPVGSYAVQFAEGTGHRYAGPDTIEVPSGRTQLDVHVEVQSPDAAASLAGVVTDRSGRALVGIDVYVRERGERSSSRHVRSVTGGRFHVPVRAAMRNSYEVFRVGDGFRDRPYEWRILDVTPRNVSAESPDLRVVVAPVEHIERTVRVIDGRDGEPLERFAHNLVVVELGDDGGTEFRGPESLGAHIGEPRTHPGGELTLELTAGWHHLLAIRSYDDGLQPVCFLHIPPEEMAVESRTILVPPVVEHHVLVTTSGGEPVADTTVAWLRPVGRRGETRRRPVRTLEDRSGATYFDVLTTSATTDAHGRAVLLEGASRTGCRLRVRGPGHLERTIELSGDDAVRGDPLHVVVEPAARITGRVLPDSLLDRIGPTPAQRHAAALFANPEPALEGDRAEVLIQHLGDDAHFHRTVPIADDGRFACGSMPPGEYRLSVQSRRVDGPAPWFESFGLTAGETRDVNLDLTDHAPARLHGTATLEGAPPPPQSTLEFEDGRLDVDADGSFAGWTWPVTDRPQLVCRARSGSAYSHTRTLRLTLTHPLTLAPGDTRARTLHFHHRQVELRVVDSTGEPVANGLVALHAPAADDTPGEFDSWQRLDADGRARIHADWHDPRIAVLWLANPFGPKRDTDPPPTTILGTLQLPANQSQTTITLTTK